jgi:hypothetical protein
VASQTLAAGDLQIDHFLLMAEQACDEVLTHFHDCLTCQQATLRDGPLARLCRDGKTLRVSWDHSDDAYFGALRSTSTSLVSL